ncbi:uncharacterized protein Hqrw_2244 [Haloquadratum walsbyi C23]|uniref:Uncharacterized protein n=1 Tax=Haloquadratum walsbyi (strain DSM 16854 / JCM 12705 / C23) TaxID=768065 RepID=G0LH96_HALWC|nr:uncharacterized protein Hqrw_2244 [Haloquadratum walsbyi C23]
MIDVYSPCGFYSAFASMNRYQTTNSKQQIAIVSSIRMGYRLASMTQIRVIEPVRCDVIQLRAQ